MQGAEPRFGGVRGGAGDGKRPGWDCLWRWVGVCSLEGGRRAWERQSPGGCLAAEELKPQPRRRGGSVLRGLPASVSPCSPPSRLPEQGLRRAAPPGGSPLAAPHICLSLFCTGRAWALGHPAASGSSGMKVRNGTSAQMRKTREPGAEPRRERRGPVALLFCPGGPGGVGGLRRCDTRLCPTLAQGRWLLPARSGGENWPGHQAAWAQALALPFACFVLLGK